MFKSENKRVGFDQFFGFDSWSVLLTVRIVPPGSPEADMFELRRPREELGRTREDEPGVHPRAAGGV